MEREVRGEKQVTSSSTTWENNRHSTDNRSLGELFGDLSSDLSTLVRKEIELARTETLEKVTAAGRSVGVIVAGAALANGGLIILLIAAVFGLNTRIDLWLAALIVGVVALVVGFFIVQSGRSALGRLNVVPEKTIATVKENVEVVKEKIQ